MVWADGEVGGGLFSAAVAAVTVYGSYVFGRAAWRTRREAIAAPTTEAERGERRAELRTILIGTLVVTAGALAAPIPLEVRVAGGVCAVAVLPLLLAEAFEPPKRARRRR